MSLDINLDNVTTDTKCSKCGHEWKKRVDSPLRCPKCGFWLFRGKELEPKK